MADVRLESTTDNAAITKERNSMCDSEINIYRDYAIGKHKTILTNLQQEVIRDLLGNKFCDNACKQVIAEAKGRIRFLRWNCANSSVNEKLADFFKALRMMFCQAEVETKALRDGNAVISLAWDFYKKYPKLVVEPWWNGTNGVYISYSDDGEALYGVKEWKVDDKTYRRNVWYENRLERYISSNSQTWKPFMLQGDEVWPLPWVKSDNTPLHIPYIHFANLSLEESFYGDSELAGGVIGFQDQVNDLQYSITAASRLTAYQQLWASGVKTPTDKTTGEPKPPTVGPGNVFTSESPDAKFGVLPAGDLSQLIAAHSHKLKRIAQMTGTPLHSITGGDWPSGDALLRAELPAVSKAWDQISRFSPAFSEVGHRLIEIWNTFSKEAKLDEEEFIDSVFADPEKRDAVSRSVIVHNLTGMISKAEALRIMEYPEEQVQKIVDEMVDENEKLPQPSLFGGFQQQNNPERTPQEQKQQST